MKKHSCITCLAVLFKFDYKKDLELLKENVKCKPEDIGILNKEKVGKYIKNTFGLTPKWNRHYFVIGLNKNYATDINEMIRVTLKNLIGKEKKMKEMCNKFDVSTSLILKPTITNKSKDAKQILSLDSDIIDFLYKSNTTMDFNYSTI